MKKPKYRHEVKHFINLTDYFTIKNRLTHIAKKDNHANPDGSYVIKSIYFDNFNNKALMEKLNGIKVREKFRIRYYNDNKNYIRLEKKMKVNTLTAKESTILTYEQCQKILNNENEWMLDTDQKLIHEFYTKIKTQFLRPKIMVEYKREAYIYPIGNVRITFDSNLKTNFTQSTFWENNNSISTLDFSDSIILEVKFDAFLPDIIRDLIQTNQRRNSAISKYATCRMYG